MLLGILSVIALGVGTYQSTVVEDEVDRLAMESNRTAVVETVQQQPKVLLEDLQFDL